MSMAVGKTSKTEEGGESTDGAGYEHGWWLPRGGARSQEGRTWVEERSDDSTRTRVEST